MKIAINTFAVTPKPGTGGSGGGKTFLTAVIKHLAKIDKDNHYYIYVSKANQSYFSEFIGNNFSEIIFPFDSDNKYIKFFFEQFIIPFYNLKLKIDVLFCPTNLAPLIPFTNVVLAIQSMHYVLAPEAMSKVRKIYHSIILPMSVKRAKKVIAVSKNIKDSIVGILKTNPGKIEVVYEGVELEMFSQKQVNKKFISRYVNDSCPYILFVSTLFKFKNADKLIKAFAVAKKEKKILHKLIVVGRDYNLNMDELKEIALNNGVFDDVIFTGPLEIETVANFYRNADLFVYPSAVETFGLPPLEAMASGTPVIGSNRTSVPEVIGDAGIIVDPEDNNALADAIVRVLSDIDLRKSLVTKGYERIRQFSWDKTAHKILDILSEVGQKNDLIKLFEQVKEVLDESGGVFWLDCGTLLGAVRDGKIIRGENDIDLGVWRDNFSDNIKNLVASKLRDKDLEVYTFKEYINIRKESAVVDINLYHLNNNKAIYHQLKNPISKFLNYFAHILLYPGNYKVYNEGSQIKYFTRWMMICFSLIMPSVIRKLTAKIISLIYEKIKFKGNIWQVPSFYFLNLSTIKFYNMELKIPAKTEEYLAYRYGEDWRIPRKDWITGRDDGAVVNLQNE